MTPGVAVITMMRLCCQVFPCVNCDEVVLSGVAVVTVMGLCCSCNCDGVVLPGVAVVTVMGWCCQVFQL